MHFYSNDSHCLFIFDRKITNDRFQKIHGTFCWILPRTLMIAWAITMRKERGRCWSMISSNGIIITIKGSQWSVNRAVAVAARAAVTKRKHTTTCTADKTALKKLFISFRLFSYDPEIDRDFDVTLFFLVTTLKLWHFLEQIDKMDFFSIKTNYFHKLFWFVSICFCTFVIPTGELHIFFFKFSNYNWI